MTELKTGCTTTVIVKKDLDQLGGSVRWDQGQYPGVQSVPVMVHPSSEYDEHGTAVPNMRVVTPLKLEQLKLAVRAYAVALADGQGRGGATRKQSQLSWPTTGSTQGTCSRSMPRRHVPPHAPCNRRGYAPAR